MLSQRSNRLATKNCINIRNGIFIRYGNFKSYNDIIEACKDLIQSSTSGGKITVEIMSENYGGVEIYLNSYEVVQELLGKRFLLDEMGDVLFTIYPLTTQLIVRGAMFSIEEYDFIGRLTAIMHDILGPVLEICKIPSLEHQPNTSNCNWGVLLDVPDIEELGDFKRVGLPDDFKIRVPGAHGILSVNFYCTRCERDGHTRWRCSGNIDSKTKSASKSSQAEYFTAESPCASPSRCSIPYHKEENKEIDITTKISPLTKKNNNRECETEIGNEQIYRNISPEIYPISDKPGSCNTKSAMKSLLLPERDYPNSQSQFKTESISPINDDYGESDNSSETSSVTNKPVFHGIFPIIFSSNNGESSSSSTMKHLLIPENYGPNRESKSKKARISTMNDDHEPLGKTSETSSTTDDSLERDIFAEFNFPYSNIDEFSSSNNDSAMKRSLFPERDDPNNESHSTTACIPSMNDDSGKWNNTFETNRTTNNLQKQDIFSEVFSSNTGKSNYFDNDFARQISLSPERDYPINKSNSKTDCISPMNDNNWQWNNTTESSHTANKPVHLDIFSKMYSSKSGKSSYSNNDFALNFSLFPESDVPNSVSLSQEAGVTAMNDSQRQSDNKSKTKSTANDADFETIFVYDPVSSTSFKTTSQHFRRLYGKSYRDTYEDFVSTSNQPGSTDDIMMNGCPSTNQGPSAENITQDRIYDDEPTRIYDDVPTHIYDDVSTRIYDVISEMNSNPLDINDLDNHAKKIRILSNIATTLNMLVADLKKEMIEIKCRHERYPERDNQFITKLESIIDKWDVSSITDVIPKRIKEIILEIKTGALDINELETFFKQTKKKKNLSNVTKTLNIDIDCLKKQLNEIKKMHDKIFERDNKEVNQFMRRLERIIIRLEDPAQVNTKRIKQIISEIKNGTVAMNELEAFVTQAKNSKNLGNVLESSNMDVGLLQEATEQDKKEVLQGP